MLRRSTFGFAAALLSFLLPAAVLADEGPTTGPATEKRFPPLAVPEGFRATLFACDPLIEYPSVIALGPGPGSLFVAHDYVTGLGVEIVRRDEIRLVSDSDGDGYADQSVLFAGGFNSIQGLAYHDGTVFAMHSPQLTALRDLDGDGIADQRRDLLDGLGLPPEDNSSRLHCGNGIIVGHDGWLYLALGDNGCDVQRPEGDQLLFRAGGILRCRTDGTDLHVFASGLRNIYDVALDDELNVFVRDNENDGGDYKIRIYHSIFGADHGYPYHYYERPQESLRPLADLGLGAAAGGVCYLEDAFPPMYRGLFFCEWGRAVMRFPRTRAGSSFATGVEIEFAAGGEADPYGFKPTDIVVDRDGSLLVSDWADGQRPKRGRGRIYRIQHVATEPADGRSAASAAAVDLDETLSNLDASSYHVRLAAQLAIQHGGSSAIEALRRELGDGHLGERARLHAVWLLARDEGGRPLEELFQLAQSDASPRVRAQAVRAIADLTDPVLVEHRLDAGAGDSAVALPLAELAAGADPRVVLECVIALGRLAWKGAPEWLEQHLDDPDPALAHAAMQTLRRCNHWASVLRLFDLPENEKMPLRRIAAWALAEQFETAVVDGLCERLGRETGARQRAVADLLTRVYRKPAPWKYWGYRPAPRSAGTVDWERTARIGEALDHLLQHAHNDVRIPTLQRMQREAVPVHLKTIAGWLAVERDQPALAVLLDALQSQPPADVGPLLAELIRTRRHSTPNRLQALDLFAGGLGADDSEAALQLAGALEEGPVLAALLRGLGQKAYVGSGELLLGKLHSQEPVVRAAAIESLGQLGSAAARSHVARLLGDPDLGVRRAAATAAGRLHARDTAEPLLAAASGTDPELSRASLESLRALAEVRAVPVAVASLDDATAQLAALSLLADLGGPSQLAAVMKVASVNRTIDVLHEVIRVATQWQARAGHAHRAGLDQAIAQIQGDSGLLLRWLATGPLASSAAAEQVDELAASTVEELPNPGEQWQIRRGKGTDARTRLAASQASTQQVWLAVSDVLSQTAQQIDALASSTGSLQIWLNGQQVHQRAKPDRYRTDSDQFTAQLVAGRNRFVVLVSKTDSPEIHLRFLPRSSSAEDARYVEHALKTRGSSKRGQEVFLNIEKSRCLKCHRMGDQGARIGPDLTGVGSRFSRIHLIESILEPSRTIAPSFQAFAIGLANGQVLSGVRIAEDAETITVGDNQGKSHTLRKADIEVMQEQTVSIMPDRLEKDLSRAEFVDLIAFLLAQKKPE